MCDLNLPQPGPWRPVPLGVGGLGPEDPDKRWERGLTAAPGLCPNGSESRHFLRGSARQPDTAPPASGFSLKSAWICLPAAVSLHCAGHGHLLEISRGKTPQTARGPAEAQQRGHHCPGEGRGRPCLHPGKMGRR